MFVFGKMAGQLLTIFVFVFIINISTNLSFRGPIFWPGTMSVDLEGDDILIRTQSGTLRGKRQNIITEAGAEVNIEKVDCFLGIPYAEPPIGKLRFKPPEPKAPWSGVRNATRFGYRCPQSMSLPQVPVDEDCLTLNIYVPHQRGAPTAPLPVMLYIHGGSYRVGTAATYPGRPLAQRGVIVVTINYRLSVLGFLSARNRYLSGNNGLLDQIEALKWVQKNIFVFGGDPDAVTIFGNSAGASSVGILMVSPLAKGLFQQSIVQSGSPFSYWAMHNNTVNLGTHARTVAQKVNCDHILWTDLADCLRGVPAKELEKIRVKISVLSTDYRPHVDGSVIPRDVDKLYDTGHINPCRVMAGVVGAEYARDVGTLLGDLRRNKKELFDQNFSNGIWRSSFEEAIHDVFQGQFGWGEFVPKVIIHEYTNWTHVHDDIANRNSYIELMSDFDLVVPTISLAKKTSRRDVPVYLYKFSHRSVKDIPQWASNAHQMELFYVFGAPFVGYDVSTGEEKKFSSMDKQMSRYMMTLWSDFAKYGDPSRTTKQSVQWEPMTFNSTDYLSIDYNDTKMLSHLHARGVSFWAGLISAMVDTKHAMDESASKRRALPTTIGVYIPVNFVLVAMCVVFGVVICVLVVCVFKSKIHDGTS